MYQVVNTNIPSLSFFSLHAHTPIFNHLPFFSVTHIKLSVRVLYDCPEQIWAIGVFVNVLSFVFKPSEISSHIKFFHDDFNALYVCLQFFFPPSPRLESLLRHELCLYIFCPPNLAILRGG